MNNPAAIWLYRQGAPPGVARAFGEYHAGCAPGTPFTAAKLRFERKSWTSPLKRDATHVDQD